MKTPTPLPAANLSDSEKETLRADATIAYEQGDYAAAWHTNTILAEAGDALGQYNLGVLHSEGRGVPQNYTQARAWYQKAAEQGYAAAQYNLGLMCANGWGGPQDNAQARDWYERAAEQGDAKAQTNLGVFYADGRSGTQDYALARLWWEKAAAQGDANAQIALQMLDDLGA